MKTQIRILSSLALILSFGTPCFAKINRVRIINDTPDPIYIHLGGYSQSKKIEPGKWHIFEYPFEVKPPNTSATIKSSLVVATAGGYWRTSPNGITTLEKPKMRLCLDYNSPELVNLTGNRKWDIKQEGGFDQGCNIAPYKQTWFTANN